MRTRKVVKALGRIYHRNSAIFDIWSIVHCLTGVLFGLLFNPFYALAVMVLWEPLEVLVISPWVWRKYKVVFGFETVRNSLSDIFFDTLGVTIGYLVLRMFEIHPVILR